MTLVLSALAFLFVAYVMVGYSMFHIACVRGKDLDWLDPEAVKKTSYGPYYDLIPTAHKWIHDHDARHVYIQSHDELKLHGWWIPAENAIGSMLMFHGYRSTYMVDFSAIYELYHHRGYNLLLVDQRSHGLSEGKYITFGVKECRDAASWVDWHNKEIGTIPVFLCGMSMGSSTVMFAAGNPLPKNVKGITADCGFTSPDDILRHVAGKQLGPATALFMPVVHFWAKLLAGFGLRECSTEKALKHCSVPILMIHGLADDFVPCEMTQRSYHACNGEKELVLVKDAGHGTSFLFEPEKVKAALFSFFSRNNPNDTGEIK